MLDSAKATFVRDLFKAAKAAKKDVSDATAMLATAHGAYESGWGKARAAREGLNYWNLTAGSAWPGPIVLGGDTEYTAGSAEVKRITQKFRKYESASAAVVNYFQFLSTPRYAHALTKLVKGDSSFVVDLGAFRLDTDGKTAMPAWPPGPPKGGFYTLPIEKYCAEFKAVLLEVQKVLAVDGVPGICS